MVTTNTDQTRSNQNSSELKEDLQKSGEELSQAMKDSGQDVSQEAKTKAEGAKNYAADEFEELSHATEAAAQALSDNHHEKLSSYVGEIAGYVDGMANNLRHKSADDLMHDANHMARENPALFIAGSLAIGLGIARLAKSGLQHGSHKEAPQNASRSSGRSQNPQGPLNELNKGRTGLDNSNTSASQGMHAGNRSSASTSGYGSESYTSSPDLRAPNVNGPNPNI